VLGGEAVGAHERHFFELLEACDVHDHAIPAPFEHAVAQAVLGQFCGLGEEVGLEEHPVEGDPQVRERLALTGDHPRARLVPQLERLAFAAQHALDQLIGGVVVHLHLARERVLRLLDRAGGDHATAGTARGDVVRVAGAHEVVALLIAIRPRLGVSAALLDARHRLAHRATHVGDPAAALDLRAGLRESRGERVADRQIAQVPDVQRLRRVRVPELQREALPCGEIGERRLGATAGLQGGARQLDPAV
jgi:hypothetical protein